MNTSAVSSDADHGHGHTSNNMTLINSGLVNNNIAVNNMHTLSTSSQQLLPQQASNHTSLSAVTASALPIVENKDSNDHLPQDIQPVVTSEATQLPPTAQLTGTSSAAPSLIASSVSSLASSTTSSVSASPTPLHPANVSNGGGLRAPSRLKGPSPAPIPTPAPVPNSTIPAPVSNQPQTVSALPAPTNTIQATAVKKPVGLKPPSTNTSNPKVATSGLKQPR